MIVGVTVWFKKKTIKLTNPRAYHTEPSAAIITILQTNTSKQIPKVLVLKSLPKN